MFSFDQSTFLLTINPWTNEKLSGQSISINVTAQTSENLSLATKVVVQYLAKLEDEVTDTAEPDLPAYVPSKGAF